MFDHTSALAESVSKPHLAVIPTLDVRFYVRMFVMY